MKKWNYLIAVYANLVKLGRMALTEDDKTEEITRVVPELYQVDVMEYLATHVPKKD